MKITDRLRLNYVIEHGIPDMVGTAKNGIPEYHYVYTVRGTEWKPIGLNLLARFHRGKTPRQAIDAAIKAERKCAS